MSENLSRITVDQPNYSRVLEEPVELEKIRNLPSELQSAEVARVWSIKPGSKNEKVYETLQPDDGLLFYLGAKHRPNGEALYTAVGRVGKKFRGDEESAREFFRNSHATRMFTVEGFELVTKTSTDIERIFGYEGYPEGSHRVRKKHYSSVDNVIDELRS